MMPPLRGIDRGLDGDALCALEKSGHGRRLAIVDASYNIPRWAEVVDYRGESSASAFKGILHLLPYEETEDIVLMSSDPGQEAAQANCNFRIVANEVLSELNTAGANIGMLVSKAYRLDSHTPGKKGFYSIANNQSEDTLFIRTRDTLPFACATFIIGHSQTEA